MIFLASDTGDVFTVNSYDEERYKDDIPQIGPARIEAHDVLDFRPRVSTYNVGICLSIPILLREETLLINQIES